MYTYSIWINHMYADWYDQMSGSAAAQCEIDRDGEMKRRERDREIYFSSLKPMHHLSTRV